MLRVYQLENFGASLLWPLATKYSDYLAMFESTRKRAINYGTGQYIQRIETIPGENEMVDEQRRTLMNDNIDQEHQRLQNALTTSEGKNMNLYSACMSLAHMCRWGDDERRLSSLQECIQAAMLIKNKTARLDALCVIALFSQTDYEQIKVNTSRSIYEEIEHQLMVIYPTLPLLLHAAVFIRCLPLLSNQHLVHQCLENLFEKFADNDLRDQQAVIEALSPYVQSHSTFVSIKNSISQSLSDSSRSIRNQSAVLKKYLSMSSDLSLSFPVCLSSLFLVELTKDLHECISDYSRHVATDESIVTRLCQFESSILTEAQALTITNILTSSTSADQSEQTKKLYDDLSKALHRVSVVELKARHLVESWLKWKDVAEFSSFAYHAALLLANSDLWSVETASIVCDLLCNENDRFRQRAEVVFRSKNDDDIRTSSKLGIDALLTLMKKRAEYQYISPSANLTLLRFFENTTVDIQSHLVTVLWMERFRIHAVIDKSFCPQNLKLPFISRSVSYFLTDITINSSFCNSIRKVSGDLAEYIYDLTASGFISFMDINDVPNSETVLESFNHFVVSIVVFVCTLNYTDDSRQMAAHALTQLMETCCNDDIHRAVAYTLGYVSDEKTYKTLFKKIQSALAYQSNTVKYSDCVVSTLISSYCHCISIKKIAFDQDDLDLFCRLLKHPSKDIFIAVRTGFGRALKDRSFLFDMLSSDPIQCYHALIDSTAYIFIHDFQQISVETTAEFIEEHPEVLSIFLIELFNSIRHFTNEIKPLERTNYYFAYGYPRYLDVAALVAVKIPAAFCTFIRDWKDGIHLKQALFNSSKQHDFIKRAASLTILSIFGELTVELCRMLIEALRDDPHIQNTCHKCLTRITSIKDENSVLDLLFSYLKSKSMNIRYFAAKMLLHLSRVSLISSNRMQIILHDLISDPDSNNDLWLIEEQDKIVAECIYYYAGSLKDVIYSLLVQHLIGDSSRTTRRTESNEIESDFLESQKASRLASCLYEAKTARQAE